MVDMKLDYSCLLECINSRYEGNTIEQKIVRFCKDIKIKVYRFKRIIENKPKCYFMSDEIIRIMKKLKIQENKIAEFFFKGI